MILIDEFCGYQRYTIATEKLSVSMLTLGATISSLRFAGRETVLAYPDAEGYLRGSSYINAAIGRYANRIGASRFTLGGREYLLPANEGKNQLHGGPNSYDKRVWSARPGDDSVTFTLFSPDGDNGFPGNLTAEVTYSVVGSALRIDYGGVCDGDTVYAPTTHLYFNLDGGSVLDHEMRIAAAGYLPVDKELIPTGQVLPAEGEFGFASLRRIGRDYDHCFVLASEHALRVQAGGIAMDLSTDFPAVQIYTGDGLSRPFGQNGGLAIEPEFYPDSPNRPEFPSCVLKKGEKFEKYAEFRFSEL